MKALEFVGRFGPHNTILVPSEVATKLQDGQAVRVIVLVHDPSDEEDWNRLATDELLEGYARVPAIAENGPNG